MVVAFLAASFLVVVLSALGLASTFSTGANALTTVADKRDFLREAVFLWRVPFLTARSISLWAARRAVSAALASPATNASITTRISCFTAVLTRLLWLRRLMVWRARFMADLIIGIGGSLRSIHNYACGFIDLIDFSLFGAVCKAINTFCLLMPDEPRV